MNKYRIREHLGEFIIEVSEKICEPKYWPLTWPITNRVYWHTANKHGVPVKLYHLVTFKDSLLDPFDDVESAKSKIIEWLTPDKFHYI